MGHYSDPRRRHRLTGPEVPSVMRAVRARLGELVEERVDFEEAVALFRVLIRFTVNTPGRPTYPAATWEAIEEYLNGPLSWIESEPSKRPDLEEEESLRHV